MNYFPLLINFVHGYFIGEPQEVWQATKTPPDSFFSTALPLVIFFLPVVLSISASSFFVKLQGELYS